MMLPSSPEGDEHAARFPIVGVGASAGGLAPTVELVSALGDEPGVAVVVVHHLDPTHASGLVEILSRATNVDALHGLPDLASYLGLLGRDLRRRMPSAPAIPGPIRPLQEIEREYILAALARNHGRQCVTAKQLQIGTATLYRKLKRYRAEGWVAISDEDDSSSPVEATSTATSSPGGPRTR